MAWPVASRGTVVGQVDGESLEEEDIVEESRGGVSCVPGEALSGVHGGTVAQAGHGGARP
jgi:hypothetical protein